MEAVAATATLFSPSPPPSKLSKISSLDSFSSSPLISQTRLKSKFSKLPRNLSVRASSTSDSVVALLDYGAGNVRSVRNAIRYLGLEIKEINGGREGRQIGAYELAKAVEELGGGAILLNCIDCDGQGKGFDIDLIKLISDSVSIPVIASSGEHFSEVFSKTNASAALAAGIFHRKEVL